MAMSTALPSDMEQDSLLRAIAEMPLPTPEQRQRDSLIVRLACVLEEMAEKIPDSPLIDEAMGWRSRLDFEQLLETWEAGLHPAQRTHGC